VAAAPSKISFGNTETLIMPYIEIPTRLHKTKLSLHNPLKAVGPVIL
jgi:hypothetical protein